MRQTLSLLLAGVVLLATASIGWAEDAKTDKKADAPTFVELRAQMHRTLAALIEARAADTPDEAKIEKLTDKLQAIRKQMWAEGAAQGWRPGPRGPWSAQQCPMGGPRMGRGPGPFGPGWGGPGPGNWQGRGYGRGQGGPGRGMGPGMGRGMGYGGGYRSYQGRCWCADCPFMDYRKNLGKNVNGDVLPSDIPEKPLAKPVKAKE